MQTVTTIGLGIAKWVFQVHGVDAAGQVVIRRQLKRRYPLAFFQKLPPYLVGIEACASSHHWSRELQALGHTVRLMPPAYVKPYVKRHKNDAVDAEAICEAVTRANMRFVATKTPEQQSCLTLHRARHLFIRSMPNRDSDRTVGSASSTSAVGRQAVSRSKFVPLCRNRVREPRMQMKGEITRSLARTTAFSASPLRNPRESLFRKRPTSGRASNDKRGADISSLDNLGIKSLRPAIIGRRVNDTYIWS